MPKPRRTPHWSACTLVCALFQCVSTPAMAMETSPVTDYRPPTGFNGLSWGAPLGALGKVTLARVNFVTNSKGKATQQRCMENPGGCASWIPSDQDVEGRGSFAVAEYYRETDRNPWAASLVALNGATYLFCDEWQSSTVRADVKDHLRLCGARIFFRSETAVQLAAKQADFESNYDRVWRHLLREFGTPDGYRAPRGEVSVGPVAGTEVSSDTSEAGAVADSGAQAAAGVVRYRWCGLRDTAPALVPPCSATVTLLFIRDTGWGMVLLATDAVYKFAQARHATHDENNELYMALISSDPARPTRRNANKCMRTTGSLVCEGRLTPMSEADRRRFEP